MKPVLPPFIQYASNLGMHYETISRSAILSWSLHHSETDSGIHAYLFVPHQDYLMVRGLETIRQGVLVIPVGELILIMGAWELQNQMYLPFPEYLEDPSSGEIPREVLGTLMAMGMLRGIAKCFWAQNKDVEKL